MMGLFLGVGRNHPMQDLEGGYAGTTVTAHFRANRREQFSSANATDRGDLLRPNTKARR